MCVRVCSGDKGGKNSANNTKQRLDVEAARDAEKDTLASQAGKESLIRWGKKILEGGNRDWHRYHPVWQCLYKVNRVTVQCQWKGSKEQRKVHLMTPIGRGYKGMSGHGLKISW